MTENEMRAMGLRPWAITKELGGHLAGIVVDEVMWRDARLPAPWQPGDRVRGLGCPYTILTCEAV